MRHGTSHTLEIFLSPDWLDSLMKRTGETIVTDMTESIVHEAREVAMDVLRGMRILAMTNANEAMELQAVFDAKQ